MLHSRNMAVKRSTSGVQDSRWTLERALPWILLVGGIIGLIASIGLSNEVFQRLKDPNFQPACNLNPIFSCTSVADSHQAEAFGFPNYFLGIAGYAALAALGTVLLAGARFKRWLWQLTEAGLAFAVLFVSWLQFETLYRIGALCLFCMIVWAATIPVFWYATLYNLRSGNFSLPARFSRAGQFLQRHHLDILVLWFLIITALILKRFWYYWSTL